MSNVLIGIIGVILFIGLALAGALFLGRAFSDAGSTSEAAGISTKMKQTADAVQLYRLTTGETEIASDSPSFLVPEYLKNLPENTVEGARTNPTDYNYKLRLSYRVWIDSVPAGTGRPASYVTVAIGEGQKARAVCQSLVNSTSDRTIRSQVLNSDPPQQTSCVMVGLLYMAYHKI
jgi:hypothetical protein